MASSMLTLLDYVEKAVTDLNAEIRRRSLKGTKVALEKLVSFSNCLKDLLPKEFTKTTFADFDRHVHFIGVFLNKRDFEWMESNLDDIRREDFPNIKTQIWEFLDKKKLPERRTAPLSNNVFIVHGRDHKPLEELKAMLIEFGLNPIVLHEKASGSRTIVEKLEKYSGVDYAFVILTPDDAGGSRHKYDKYLRKIDMRAVEDFCERARQNVILEFGYFIGKLGRDKVCCLHKGNVELPSDMQGIVYIPFKDSVEEARDMIIKELMEAGYEIKKTSREIKYFKV